MIHLPLPDLGEHNGLSQGDHRLSTSRPDMDIPMDIRIKPMIMEQAGTPSNVIESQSRTSICLGRPLRAATPVMRGLGTGHST